MAQVQEMCTLAQRQFRWVQQQPHAGLPQCIVASVVQYNSKRTSLVAMHIVILAAVITYPRTQALSHRGRG